MPRDVSLFGPKLAASQSRSFCSVVEEDFCPLTERISSLIEISSLVEAASPLDKLLIFWTVAELVFVGAKVSIIELLLPRLHILGAV